MSGDLDKDGQIKNKGKRKRYGQWLADVRSMADKYGITLTQAVRIIDASGIKDIRCLLNSVESDEFISYYLYKIGGK